VSITAVHTRIAEIQGAFVPRTPVAAATAANFSGALQGAVAAQPGPAGLMPAAAVGGTPAGQAMVAAAQAEVGQAEQPPGSNDSPRIAQYRQATAGSSVAPWCSYFTSWAARQAGVPVGPQGQGIGSVDALYSWAQGAGKAIPAGPGVTPQPGDLIVWDEHVGIVESVAPDGRIQTIEGNSSDQVSRRTHDASGDGAVGYVRLG
jgi:CHAP domain